MTLLLHFSPAKLVFLSQIAVFFLLKVERIYRLVLRWVAALEPVKMGGSFRTAIFLNTPYFAFFACQIGFVILNCSAFSSESRERIYRLVLAWVARFGGCGWLALVRFGTFINSADSFCKQLNLKYFNLRVKSHHSFKINALIFTDITKFKNCPKYCP